MSFRELEPRASRLWIRFSPRRWPAGGAPFLDLAERRIVWPAAGGRSGAFDLPSAVPSADVVLLPPSNPVVSVGPIVGVQDIRDALRTTPAPVVGVSPIIGGSAVRGMANQLLTGLGVEVSARGVAGSPEVVAEQAPGFGMVGLQRHGTSQRRDRLVAAADAGARARQQEFGRRVVRHDLQNLPGLLGRERRLRRQQARCVAHRDLERAGRFGRRVHGANARFRRAMPSWMSATE